MSQSVLKLRYNLWILFAFILVHLLRHILLKIEDMSRAVRLFGTSVVSKFKHDLDDDTAAVNGPKVALARVSAQSVNSDAFALLHAVSCKIERATFFLPSARVRTPSCP